MAIISEPILSQLYDDAPFAWHLYHQATQSPLFDPQDIETLRYRLKSYLRLLSLAQESGHHPIENIDIDDVGSLFALTWLGIKHRQTDLWQKAVDYVDTLEKSDELASALVWFNPEQLKDILVKLGFSQNPWLRRATLKYAQFKKIRLTDGYLQDKISGSAEPEVLTALESIAHQSNKTAYDLNVVKIESEACSIAKLYVRFCHGEPEESLLIDIRQMLDSSPQMLRDILPLLFSLMPIESVEKLLSKILHSSYSNRLKIYAIGIAGLPNYIPTLLNFMDSPEWAPLAAEALSMITGVDIEAQDLSLDTVQFQDKEKQQEYEFLSEETWQERSKRDALTQAYELELPFPDIHKIQQWWVAQSPKMICHTRYFSGCIPSMENLERIFRMGNQLHRRYAALYIKRLEPQEPMRMV